MTAIDDIFTALFTGSGSWLGLLLFLTLILGITFAWKYGGLLVLPVTVFLTFMYFDAGLGWQGLIMVLTGVFILTNLTVQAKKGGD